MKREIFTVDENRPIAKGTYLLRLSGCTDAVTAPGQFVGIKLDGFYLRRPISVCDYSSGQLLLIYKVVGEGTEKMSALSRSDRLDVLVGLGNGYDAEQCRSCAAVIGGGVGVPPLYALSKKLKSLGKTVHAVLGFNSKDEMFFIDEFSKVCDSVTVTTADGSYGKKGFVTDALGGLDFDYFFSCGPEPMLKAVCENTDTSGQLSFERRMGCGFGACMGCSCETLTGYKRICKEGPVLRKEELLW